MNIHTPDEHAPKDGKETPPEVALNRRSWLRAAGYGIASAGALGGGAYWGWKQWQGTDEEVLNSGKVEQSEPVDLEEVLKPYPARRDNRFAYGREETERVASARFTNFYEFSVFKTSWRLVGNFQVNPWSVEIAGLCNKPLKFDMDDFYKIFRSDLVERLYRHRCVEKWAMAVPWTGIPLRALLEKVDPKSTATHVRFISFMNRGSTNQDDKSYPWPYNEGLTIDEAKVDLAFIAVGMYGEPLLKQNGAPIRLVVPWKYGFKSIKSITRIELVDKQPATFWNTVRPRAYGFESNVNPRDVEPWAQTSEQMLGTGETHPTVYLNGYQKEVGHLYKA